MIEHIIRHAIAVDFAAEYLLGSDQVCESYPVRFPTVGLELIATDTLNGIADQIRRKYGFQPMFTDDAQDLNGWYNFYIGLNGYFRHKVDNCITFTVVNSDSPDNEQSYTIPLTVEERDLVFHEIDMECRKHLGKSADDLLAEAQAELDRHGF